MEDQGSPQFSGECTEKMGVDEMLRRYAGEFGPWQLRHFMLTSIAWALNAFHTIVVVFTDHQPAWRCSSTGGACPATMCALPPGSWEWAGGRRTSTVAEWGLVCKAKYKVGMAQSAFFAGSMLGAGIFGHLSDSFLGRKGTLTLVCAMNATFGFLTSLSPSLYIYAFLRFLTGLSTGGVGLSAFVLTTEPIGPAKRGTIATSTFYFFSIGTILLSIFSLYFHHSWRSLYIFSSLPSLLFLLLILPFISESPRWYLVRQKTSNAMKVMQKIAKSNGKHIPDGVSLTLDGDISTKSSSILDVLRNPVTRARLLLLITINLLNSIAYYGLILNVMNVKTNIYLNVMLNGVAEMPAYVLTAAALKWYGRKPLTVGTMVFSGVCCGVGSLMEGDGWMGIVRMVCGVLGVFASTMGFDLVFVYTAELFPTVVRNAAVGSVTQGGQTGAVVAPLVVAMGGRWAFLVFAVCEVVGGVMALYLPETLNQPLYDTMVGLEKGEVEKRDKGAQEGDGC
ncbi:hypothetical protein J5N97_002806 [Dioscorea zingiberensis]|uniref:H(+)/Pi cotransporter n=1 Tax=Dioscorea zingiberensis TaxID=325984 RepID=A0A9D5HPH5_9LILI|nr:hypothetical protein J5N97_002806 [Dioscorea zingiberensis]